MRDGLGNRRVHVWPCQWVQVKKGKGLWLTLSQINKEVIQSPVGALRKSRQSLFKLTWGRVILCGKPFLSRQNFQNFFTHHCVLGAQESGTIQHIRGNLETQFQVLILLLTSMRTTASSSLKWGREDALLTLLHYPNVWWVSEKRRGTLGETEMTSEGRE